MRVFFITLILSSIVLSGSSGAQQGDQKFEGFNLQGYTEEGDKSWDVNGDTADIVGTEIKLSNVNANSYGEQNMNVTAETGYVDQTNGKMRLEKDVVITSETGSQLITETLDWSRDDDLVSTEDDVLITDKSFTAEGKGMKAKPGLKNAQINKDVTVRVDPDPKKEGNQYVTITSKGPMTIDQQAKKARFEEDVVAVQEDQTLKADVMEIFFNEDMNDISKLVCIGNVEISQGENITYADKATYDAATQKVVLSGRPKLILLTEGENAFTAFGD